MTRLGLGSLGWGLRFDGLGVWLGNGVASSVSSPALRDGRMRVTLGGL